MSKIIDAVSVILVCDDSLFAIKRQNFLRAFPGYWAFPGGKVDANEKDNTKGIEIFEKFDNKLINAVVRETEEELGIDLVKLAKKSEILKIDHLGLAITPDFNPYRYATYFFKITLNSKPKMKVDENEAAIAQWMTGKELLEVYQSGKMLAVPPVLKTYERLAHDIHLTEIPDLDFTYDSTLEVPMIESMVGIRQLMPLSLTLPPADRTNCFFIGDKGENQLLIDPSPKDEQEYNKLIYAFKKMSPSHIFLTHHHADHIQFSEKIARDFGLPMLMSKFTCDILKSKKGKDFFKGIDVKIVEEGNTVTKWLGKNVKVYEIPGHDEGQLALAPASMEWFIAGDLFQGVGTVVVGGPEGDMTKYFETLEKVIKLNPDVVFPSHGIGLGGTLVLQKTLEHRKMREEQVLDLYLKGKKEKEILEILYFETPKVLHAYALANIKSHIIKLKKEKRIQD